ncbi:glycosyltransferase [bacterium]|nr:MAG: glycosyltransferase [bacterium]
MAVTPEISPKKASCALAIFCRAPRLGQVKTRLAATHGDGFALELYRAMLADSFALGAALAPSVDTFACFTPDDAFRITPDDDSLSVFWDGPRLTQCSGNLGDKMLDALTQLRRRGYQRIVLIGSDSPDVPLERLRSAFEALEKASLVFGPAPDGGFYLMGTAVEIPALLFEDVPWSSAETLRTIYGKNAKRGEARLECAELSPWRDVDDEADLQELWRRLFEDGTWAPQTRKFLEQMGEL